jgi:hypothetical protein
MGEDLPEYGWHHPIDWRPGWSKKGKRRKLTFSLSLFPGYHDMSCSVSPCPPCHDELKFLTLGTKINLSSFKFFCSGILSQRQEF